jgi:hypothetical protein
MTTYEFSNEFDTLLDSYKIKDGFGENENLFDIKLDEYEKFVLLTRAQSIIAKKYVDLIDIDPKVNAYFYKLIQTDNPNGFSN